ncbi:hypothetical protein BO71DRAFT_430227 [Aspergillus ellipticus CBS 707.79]|uniref:Xylanolytic transcriptional activator regulatory domain-containing protein n=1 Tax=Aspergillus ellipticus CBS 707.79 TaxID=1448320 RepID=A0A319E106_9EURO|nr:hypothetical protein BO71DRAFT_430227 [Aspergillus ellipticus CBS 707.79]
MAATHAGPPLANGLQPLSCLRCAHRKKRQRRRVVVPTPGSSRTQQCVRLERYKEVFKDLGADVESIANSPQGSNTIVDSHMRDNLPPGETEDAIVTAATGNDLVVMGGKSPYIESNLWTRIGEDSYAGRIHLDPDSRWDGEKDTVPDERTGPCKVSGLALGVLSPETPSVEELYPPQQHFQHLWQTYLSNIHPVTMILHGPSAGEVLTAAMKGHGRPPKDVEALLFAAMACALVFVTDAECTPLLGCKKSILFARYRLGCEVALTNASFLISSKVRVLQAYTIYLVAIGPHVDPCELWNLTGIAKRNARRLGLHQESFTAALTPFQMEMRRRLWSQIVMYDAMAAQSADLYQPDPHCHTLAPRNVNDTDWSPSMKDPPMERVGATDMTFCNLRYKVMKVIREVNSGQRPWALPTGEQKNAAVEQLYRAEREKAIGKMEEEVELDPFSAIATSRLTLCKLRFTALYPGLYDSKELQDCTEKDRELLFSTALKVLEYDSNAHSQSFIHGFLWHMHQHFQWSCLMHVLEYLKTRPGEEHVDRTWKQIHRFYGFRPYLFQGPKHRLPLYKRINKMVIEEWHVQERRASERGQLLICPTYITALREQVCPDNPKGPASNSQSPSTVRSPQKSVSDHTNPDLLSGGQLGQEPVDLPNWAGFNIAVSGSEGNDMYFLDPTLAQEISMSAQGPPGVCYGPQELLLPLDRYAQRGDKW